ncbi:MAG TPA: hypothetical protein VHL78_01470, partial [Actinomycetota bacterium]|nr:hypothetical protein [Actinomycetota bacterium]
LDAPDPEDVPASLPEAAAAVARRIQLEVLTGELKHLADAIEADRDVGGADLPGARAVARDIEAAEAAAAANGRPAMDPQDAVRLFLQADVGRERISEEVGSDLFTATASTAAAVTVSAAQGKRSGLGGMRMVLSALRGLVLGLYVLAKSAMSKRRTALAVMLTLLAAGGAVVAFAILDEGTSAWLVWAGIGVLLAGLALATARAGPWWVFGLMAATVLLALSPWIVLEAVALSDPARARLADAAPVFAVIVAVLGSMLLGLVRAGALSWLPRDSRLAGQVVGIIGLGVLIAVGAVLQWSAGIMAVAALALGALLGWSLRDLTWRGAVAWLAAAPGRLAAWARSDGLERFGRRAGAVADVLAVAGALGALLAVLVLAGAGPLAIGVAFGLLGAAAGLVLRLLRAARDAWVAAEPPAGGADTVFTLRWAPDGAPDGHVYDVVVRPPGERRFAPWRSDRRDGSVEFGMADLPGGRPGTYAFRARRRRVLSGRHWGWSRPVRVKIGRTPAGATPPRAAAPAEPPADEPATPPAS